MKILRNALAPVLVSLFAFTVSSALAADAVWIDVRSKAEYEAEHLEGTTLIPHTSIREGVSKLGLDKSTPIKLFCRSGGRAGMAKKTLESMGYTDVENLGGIGDARKVMEKSDG